MQNRILLLLFIGAQLYFVFEIIKEHYVHPIFLVVFSVLFFVLSLAYNKSKTLHINTKTKISWDVFPIFLVGTFTTYFLQSHLGFHVVFAAGLVGFLGSFLNELKFQKAKNWPVAIYCGAFVGMTQLGLGYQYILLASLFAASFYTFTQHYFFGIGGKLGTLAFMGVFYSFIIYKLFL